MNNIISKALPNKNLVTAIILFVMGLTSMLGHMLQGEKIVFSGTESSSLYLRAGENFVCELSINTVPASKGKTFSLSGCNGETVLGFFPISIHEDEKNKIRLQFKIGDKVFDCGTHIVNFDNPKGKFDFKIFSENGNVTVQWRERCDLYQSLFHPGGSGKIILPEIDRIEIPPDCDTEVKLIKTPWNRKAWEITKGGSALFFLSAIFILAGLAGCRFPPKEFSTSSGMLAMRVALCSVSVVILLTLVYFFIPENMGRIPDISDTLLCLNSLNPEPGEQILYLTALLGVVISSISVNFLLSEKENVKTVFGYRGSCFILWSGLIYLILEEEKISAGMPLAAYRIFCVLMMLLGWFFVVSLHHNKFRQYSCILPLGILCCYIFMTAETYFFTQLDIFDAHHYSVVLHPIWQSFYGMAPMESYTTYGGYAFFALPFFKLTGLNSITVDFFWFGLILLTWFLLFKGISVLIKSQFFRFCAIAAICGLGVLNGSAARYAQYLPLRMIFPAALFCWIACNLRSRFSPVTISVGSVIASVAVLWNPESGIVLLIAWALYLFSVSFGSPKRQLGKIFLFFSGSCVSTIAVVSVVYHAIYGMFPNYAAMLRMPLVFGAFGNLQLPLPVLGWWCVAAVVYLAVLVWACGRIMHRSLPPKSGVVLFTAILGCGLFGYYVGRSHPNNLYLVIYPVFILIAWSAERLNSRKNTALKALLVFLLLLFMGMGSVASFSPKTDSAAKAKFTQFFYKFCDDLKKVTVEEKRIVYSGPLEALIAIETGVSPAFAHPALDEMIFKKDVVSYCNNIKANSKGAIWLVNMNYINKLAPDFLKKQVTCELKNKIKRTPGNNEMLVLRL